MSERPVIRAPGRAPATVARRRPVQPVPDGGVPLPATPLSLAVPEGPPLVVAGLRLVLEGFADRVRLRASATDVDVVLVDAAHRCGPVRLPMGRDEPVVVLVREGDLAAARSAREAGASPVPITASPAALVDAVESAHRRRGRPGRSTRSFPDTPTRDEPAHALSAREEQVLSGVCAGFSNEDIAAELYVSINSVKTYIRSAYRKMGVTRRGQAVVWGIRRGYGEAAPASSRDGDGGG